MTSSWFFLSTLNYDVRSATHQINNLLAFPEHAVFNSQLAKSLQLVRETENMLNKHLRTADKGWPFSLGVGARCLKLLTVKTREVTKHCTRPRTCFVAGCCECGNEPSGPTKCGEFLDLLASREEILLHGDNC